jgi:DNA-binding IclR family transcriptional regulator
LLTGKNVRYIIIHQVHHSEFMYNAPILKKALSVIRLVVRENKPLGVTEIAKKLAISKSTAFGILKALEEEGFVVKDSASKKYITGSELFELSKRIMRTIDLTAIARPFLEKLVEVVDESAFLGVRDEDGVKVMDAVEPRKEFKISSPIGACFSLDAGVIGKVFLSCLENDEVVAFLSKQVLPSHTENSITDIDLFLEEIEKTRKCGYAIDLEEYLKGLRAIGAPVYSGHFPVGAIWVVGFTSSMNDEKLPDMISQVKDAAERISARLSPFLSK